MNKTIFFITSIGEEGSFTRKRIEEIFQRIIEPSAKKHGYEVIRGDKIAKPGDINKQIVDHLLSDDLAIADLTSLNPNVMYELGLRHAFNKHTILLMDKSPDLNSGRALPFDIQTNRIIYIELPWIDSADKRINEISEQIKNIEANP